MNVLTRIGQPAVFPLRHFWADRRSPNSAIRSGWDWRWLLLVAPSHDQAEGARHLARDIAITDAYVASSREAEHSQRRSGLQPLFESREREVQECASLWIEVAG